MDFVQNIYEYVFSLSTQEREYHILCVFLHLKIELFYKVINNFTFH